VSLSVSKSIAVGQASPRHKKLGGFVKCRDSSQ